MTGCTCALVAVGELKYLENADVGKAPGAVNVEGPNVNVASLASVDPRQAKVNANCFTFCIAMVLVEQFCERTIPYDALAASLRQRAWMHMRSTTWSRVMGC